MTKQTWFEEWCVGYILAYLFASFVFIGAIYLGNPRGVRESRLQECKEMLSARPELFK